VSDASLLRDKLPARVVKAIFFGAIFSTTHLRFSRFRRDMFNPLSPSCGSSARPGNTAVVRFEDGKQRPLARHTAKFAALE
jgi:hypothetical protein